METAEMGKVLVAARVQNLDDLNSVRKGLIAENQVRTVEIPDALVDTGATGLLLPARFIEQLGLHPFKVRDSRTVGGRAKLQVYDAVNLTVQGRDCITDVTEISDDLPALIGQIPLELMDWVVDLRNHRLIGNPDHNGEFMHDAL